MFEPSLSDEARCRSVIELETVETNFRRDHNKDRKRDAKANLTSITRLCFLHSPDHIGKGVRLAAALFCGRVSPRRVASRALWSFRRASRFPGSNVLREVVDSCFKKYLSWSWSPWPRKDAWKMNSETKMPIPTPLDEFLVIAVVGSTGVGEISALFHRSGIRI